MSNGPGVIDTPGIPPIALFGGIATAGTVATGEMSQDFRTIAPDFVPLPRADVY